MSGFLYKRRSQMCCIIKIFTTKPQQTIDDDCVVLWARHMKRRTVSDVLLQRERFISVDTYIVYAQNDGEQQNTDIWNGCVSCCFPTCVDTQISEARNAHTILLQFTKPKGSECDIKCITSPEFSLKNSSSLTSN